MDNIAIAKQASQTADDIFNGVNAALEANGGMGQPIFKQSMRDKLAQALFIAMKSVADRAAAEVDADRERLDWVLALIRDKGTNGLRDIPWTLVDDDPERHPEETMEEDEPDRLTPTLDRAAIDAARTSLRHGPRPLE